MNSSRIVNRSFIKEAFLYGLAIVLHPFLRVKKGRVVYFSYYGKQYSCNPKYIFEYITVKYPAEFDNIWLFRKGCEPTKSIEGARSMCMGTFKALLAINTAEYIITNCRTLPRVYNWVKSGRQKYIMTWHGGLPIKKVEADAQDLVNPKYINAAKADSSIASLFLSESRYTSELYRKSFWYNGEILEKGIPRSDVFYNTLKHDDIIKRVRNYFDIEDECSIVLYAPTFREDYSLDMYDIDWKSILPELQKLLRGRVKVLVRLHPNFISKKIDTSEITKEDFVFDATNYNEINDLLISSSVLISDYSSCMFDFAILKRPCFIYAKDSEEYDRGFYFSPRDLAFPFATNNIELKKNIESFDNDEYQKELSKLMNEKFGVIGEGKATESVVEWMINNKDGIRQA